MMWTSPFDAGFALSRLTRLQVKLTRTVIALIVFTKLDTTALSNYLRKYLRSQTITQLFMPDDSFYIGYRDYSFNCPQ